MTWTFFNWFQEDEARVTLDRDTNEFVVLPGKNLKVAKPVTQVREEL